MRGGPRTDHVEWIIPGMFHHTGKEAFDSEIEYEAFVGSPSIGVDRLTEENDVVVAEDTVRSARRDGSASSTRCSATSSSCAARR